MTARAQTQTAEAPPSPPPVYEQPVAVPAPPPPVVTSPEAPMQPVAEQLPPVVAVPPPPPPKPMWTVPKALFLTVGWSYTTSNSLPLSTMATVLTPQGVNLDGGFLWQVRGFDGVRWPAWVGFMTGFFYYVGATGINDSLGLDYGILVKHALFPQPRIRMYLAYGLGAAMVWIRDVDGRGLGGFERLSIGADIHAVKWLHVNFEVSYRFFELPTFKLADTDSGGYNFQTLSVLAGFWFGR